MKARLRARSRTYRSRQIIMPSFFSSNPSFLFCSPPSRWGLRLVSCPHLVPDVSERLVDGVDHHRRGEAASLVQLVPHLVASKHLV